ncbi:MAG: Rnase Y domain-containing protein [Candidatus Omnitrophica bacterium]|nr:Rnase Y domain-containing protein [Candidatus Omnitrophota bacterium]
MILNIVVPIFVALVAVYCGYFLRKHIAEKRVKSAELQAEHILEAAKKDVLDKRREAELEAKDLLFRMRQDFEREIKDRKLEIVNLEKRLTQKDENIDRRIDLVERKEKEIEVRNDHLKKQEESLKLKENQLQALIAEEKERLQKISSLSVEEARQILLGRLNEELNNEKAVFIKRQEEEVRSIADKKAREILSLAILCPDLMRCAERLPV